jgi:hypothetical protein
MSWKDRVKAFVIQLVKVLVGGGFAVSLIAAFLFLPPALFMSLLFGVLGVAVGIGMIPGVVYSDVLPSSMAQTLGRRLLTIEALANGPSRINELRTGNYDMERDDGDMPPEENRIRGNKTLSGLTYELHEGCWGESVLPRSPKKMGLGKASSEDDTVVLMDGGRTWYDSDEVKGKTGIKIRIDVITSQLKSVGKTSVIKAKDKRAKDQHGGNTGDMSSKVLAAACLSALVIGLAIGVPMFLM